MEQLTLLEELQDLRRGARQSARRAARRGSAPSGADADQRTFDFERAAERPGFARVLTLPTAAAREREADAWYQHGCELEGSDPTGARAAYERALGFVPAHADAHLNLGCLDHETGRLADAETHYRAALAARADDVTARFDLAVVLEDQGKLDEARKTYLACLAADPACAEAHFNLARLCERAGDVAAALRHLSAYRRRVAAD